MNTAMWNHPITAKQIQILEGEWEIVHPIKYGEANIYTWSILVLSRGSTSYSSMINVTGCIL